MADSTSCIVIRHNRGKHVEDEGLAALKQLQLLRVLLINACAYEDKDIIRKLDNLSPPTRIEELYLRHFLGETTPAWINPISLPQLQYLCIEDSRVLRRMSENFWEVMSVAGI